ncbi:MAG: M2 family metallopeptidase [Deltaproteobacteria bacterium]|nr:M2 family metallopeptidase [Deltaproteobacteria bacterium]
MHVLLTAVLLTLSAARPPPKPAPGKKPTAADAKKFFDDVDKDLRRLWVARDRAAWVNENFITDDTEFLSAKGEEDTAEYFTRMIPESARFDGLKLPPDLQRMHDIFKVQQLIPAPADPAKRAELAQIKTAMDSGYGKAKYCKPNGKCLSLDDLEKTLAESRNYDELVDAWVGWHDQAAPMRQEYVRYVELANEGAREIGFPDVGALWRSQYDMPPDAFAADEERLWAQVKPLYEALHCYVRKQLHKKYGDKVPAHGLIPVPLTGNMWGQDFVNIYPLVEPYPGASQLDVSKSIEAKKISPQDEVKIGEKFFTSLGFAPLPDTFWKRSLFTRPADRDVVCHASAWDPQWNGDVRLKMCITPTETDLVTIHHELGHDFYFLSYDTLPMLFQNSANDGFHEAIGDTIALSVTPSYYKQIGLLNNVSNTEQARMNQLMKRALEKVAFLPFGLFVDKWRWQVFDGKVKPENYNAAWWALKAQYQGEAPPVSRDETKFDPGAKYHVASSTPYTRYFLSFIYQFQFHRALCKAAGFTGPIDECSIYGNKAAGEKLRKTLAMGQSRPWQDAMQELTGQREADASAILDYFAPLKTWLDQQNKGEQCGW